jgi:hypothetical protein
MHAAIVKPFTQLLQTQRRHHATASTSAKTERHQTLDRRNVGIAAGGNWLACDHERSAATMLNMRDGARANGEQLLHCLPLKVVELQSRS